MKHQEIELMLNELIDGELASGDEKIVRQHLKTCAHCRDLFRSFQELHAFAKNRPAVPVRPGFAQRVLTTYNSRSREKMWQFFDILPKPLATAALAFSIILVGLFASPLLLPPQNNFESEYTLLFDANAEANHVTDDQALAIALHADVGVAIGE